MLATRKFIEGLVTGLTLETGITFIEGKHWAADVKERVVTYNLDQVLFQDTTYVRALVLHELSHLLYTEPSASTPTPLEKKEPILRELYNAFEDMRIEHQLTEQRYGAYSAYAFINLALLFSEEFEQKKIPEYQRIIFFVGLMALRESGIYFRGYYSYTTTELHNAAHEFAAHLRTTLSPEAANILDKLYMANVHQYIINKLSTGDLIRYVDAVLYPILKPILPDRKKGQSFGCVLVRKRGYRGARDKSSFHHDSPPLPSKEEILGTLSPYITVITQRLSDILKEKEATRHEGAYRKGKLLPTNTYKVLTGEERIFSRKVNPRKPHYAMTLVLDGSGSMQGHKHSESFKTALMLEEIARRLKFTFTGLVFSDEVEMGEVDATYRNPPFAGNCDFEVMHKVASITDKTDDNIVFVLADGGVSASPREVVKELKANDYIVIPIGVGMDKEENEELSKHYDGSIAVPRAEDLTGVLLQELRKVIRR